ncbi:L-aspartate oxidase, partial [Gemmatimonadota bacterium]
SYQLGKVVAAQHDGVFISHNREALRMIMWDYVGIVRSNDRLSEAANCLRHLERRVNHFCNDMALTPELGELRNMVTVATLIVKCAQKRKESRGLHQNVDYPGRNDRTFVKDTVLENKF